MVREMADELYIKRVLMVLEDFLFFSLYSFSCIASNSTTWKYILIFVPRYALRVQSCNILITCARPRPLHHHRHNEDIRFVNRRLMLNIQTRDCQRELRSCHTLSRVNTVSLKQITNTRLSFSDYLTPTSLPGYQDR